MSKDVQNISFIGLGNMGYPMASHLSSNGYNVTVQNRTQAKSEQWCAENKGSFANNPATASQNADVLILCVGNDDDVRQVLMGDNGALASLSKDTLVIDHTTASAALAREIGQIAQERQIAFLDAPVSGGSVGARNGKLSIMVGGNQEHYDKALPIMQCYGAAINLMGPIGSGQLTKMVNQICIAGTLQGVAEAMMFGLNADLDMDKVLSVIAKGAAQSWQLENRGPWMLEDRYEGGGFAVDLMKKDLSLCIEESHINGSHLPVATMINGFFTELQEQGKGKWDFSSLFELLK